MEQRTSPDNVIYVGNKPPMNYVLAAITQLSSGSKEVAIKARGRAISRAVDVAEIIRRRFMPETKIRDIQIATEEVTNEEGQKLNVSSIEIYLNK
ncbi:MAG: DNA-binding protein Alba [Candidatus Thermoplasmatota archaeon]|nr:DNA-binding protein Alba [Candidatus Thermoplasmatota archaeon]MDD5777839.1 DNA-binding protein Alba [Candidatus Thermoplasmatota archaeon]